MSKFTCWGFAFLVWGLNAQAAQVSVAVASNFSAPMQKIAQAFEQETGHKAMVSFGATGHFYAQIKNGAPFEVLLAADEATPRQLGKEGLGLAASRFTYAVGTLVLWSKQAGLVDDKASILQSGRFERIAMANPKLAPYGAAAIQTLNRMGILRNVQPKVVQGDNMSQAYQFVATGNAQLGFVALSQVMTDGKITQGSAWLVPDSLHTPIQQDAILLAKGAANPAATALLNFLRTERAKAVMRAFGYKP